MINTLEDFMDPVYFDWSTVTRRSVYYTLFDAVSILGTEQISVKLVQSTFRKTLKQLIPVKVTSSRNKLVQTNEIYVGGFYYSERDQDGLEPIEIKFSYCPKQTYIDVTYDQWSRLCMLVADVVLHEIIHLKQYRHRDFSDINCYVSKAEDPDQRTQQEYLGDRDEVEAYGFNIACELWDKFGDNINKSTRWLDSDRWQYSPMSQMHQYMIAFDGDHNHPVIQKLKKHARRYLTNYRIDKPFRTRKYLTM